jgi:hypothetical protein
MMSPSLLSANWCRCFGIEIQDNPARYSVDLLSRSENLLNFCHNCCIFANLTYKQTMVRLNCCTRFQECAEREHVELAPIELHHGDFLTSAAVKEAISSAGLVYMNNPLFGATLNLKVLGESLSRPSPSRKEFLCSMAKQLSSDQLCPLMPKGCKLVLQPSF